MTGIQASRIIKELTRDELSLLRQLIDDTIITYNFSNNREMQVIALINQIYEKQARMLSQLILQGHRDSYNAVFDRLGVSIIPIQRSAVEALARDTIRDYAVGIESSINYIRSIFRESRQDILTEARISESVLDSLMNGGTFRESAEDLKIEFLKTKSTDLTKIRKLKPTEVTSRMARIRRSMTQGKEIPKYLKTKVLEKAHQKLKNGKFITIVNRNNQPMTFSLDYYSGLIARSRVADSQVEGTLEAGRVLGVELYYVTEHNTETKICKQFEGRYLSSSTELVGRIFKGKKILELNSRSRPTYHPNCKHRLLAYPLTDSELEKITGKQYAA